MLNTNSLIVTLLGLCFSISSFSQEVDTALNKNPEAFAQKIEERFDRLNSDKHEAILERFLSNWSEGRFTVEEQNLVFEIEEKMNANQFRISEGYSDYLKALSSSLRDKVTFKKFKQWHNVLDKMVEKRRNFNQVNQMLTHLFRSNIIYKSRSKDWYISKFTYNLTYNGKPIVKIPEKVNLSCITKGDTLTIHNTKGNLNILSNQWKGKSGKVTWKRVNLNPDQVYAQFDEYNMKLKKGKIKVNGATFYNKKLFEKGIKGQFKDKVYIADKGQEANYPRFKSAKQTFSIDKFFQNITYIGGFSMEGRDVIGSGTDEEKAKIKIYRNGNLQLLAKSKRFLIAPNSIDASKTISSIYFKGDSIYHSNIRFKYLEKNNTAKLSRPNKGLGQSPFYDSYHNLEIDVDIIKWNISQPTLSMRMTINSVEPAKFKSDNYFTKGSYQGVQGILEYNPLDRLNKYAKRFNTYRIGEQEMADYLGIELNNMQKMLFRLSKKGFINYYIDKQEFVIKDKLTHYFRANKEWEDYDKINLKSKTGNNKNGEINLSTGDFELDGVKSVPLSKKKNVIIYPRNNHLTFKENRDIEFNGQMTAGRFHYFGDGFGFKYDSFKVNLNNVDSMLIYYPDEESGELVKVKNVLQDIKGSVQINHANNKSGKVDLLEYPIFDCVKESAVYYEKPNIYNNVYKKDSFYFQVEPFTVDSLNSFDRKGIQFEGTFYSDNIFPEFDHYLTLMEDNSLGFKKRTPTNGYPLYGGKGRGYMEIELSNEGLWGKGHVNYVKSKTESQNFLFFPDSMNSHSESFSIPKEGQNRYPKVSGTQVYNHWVPYKDSMYIREKEPLSVYDKEVKFEGDLVLTPDELYGTGTINFDRAVLKSNALALKPNNVKSDSASFKIKSDVEGAPSFFTKNTTLNLDFANKKLSGSSNAKEEKINLKKHMYQTTIEEYTWNIDEKNVYMKTPPDQNIEDAFMLSTNPKQDSLQFNTTAAFFDLEKSQIEARNIPHINIADAQAYPSNGEVTIKENSKLEVLNNAKLVADTTYFFHEFFDATIKVLSRNDYGATAKYAYEDRSNNKDTIKFEKIFVDEKNRTVGEGEIKGEEKFNLSPRFRFEGKVNLKAWRKELAFEGLVLPENIKPSLRTEKIQFADTVHADSIYISVDDAQNENDKKLYSGVFMNKRKNELYNLFMGRKKNPRDYPLFKASGYLYYSYLTGKYKINKRENIESQSSPLHQFTYSDETHKVKTTGDVNLNLDNQRVDMRVAGNIIKSRSDTAHTLDLVMGLDFNFDPDAIKIASDSINNLAFYRPDTRDGRDVLRNVLPNIIKNEEALDKTLQSLKDFDMMVTNDAYKPNFLFSQLKLKWHPDRKAFVHEGNIGLANMKNTSINKQLDGKMTFQTGIAPDQLRFYLSSTNGNYYYFNIGGEVCKVFASDPKFKTKVSNTAGDFSKGDYEIILLKDAKEKLFFEQSFNQ